MSPVDPSSPVDVAAPSGGAVWGSEGFKWGRGAKNGDKNNGASAAEKKSQ